MKKRILQFGMTAKAVMIALLLGVAGKIYAYDFSAVCETGQTLYYNIIDAENHYVELTCPNNYGWYGFNQPTGDIHLPESVQYEDNDYLVFSIADYAFYNCNGLTGNLTIPNSVTTIGSAAFNGCSGFTGSLIISNSVTTIGDYSFSVCGFTGSLNIPNSVTFIGTGAFAGCSSFTGSLTLPNSVTMISEGTFSGCGFTGTLTISDSVTMIGEGAFVGCGFTGSLSIPNSVTEIGANAFNSCSGFTGDLVIPNSVTTIGDVAFSGCRGFTGDLIIPNSVNTIGNGAFMRCIGFNGDLIIGDSVTTIGMEAFYECNGFTGSLTIGNSVTTIGMEAFFNCSGLSGSLTIPNSVTTIYESAFYNCSGFTGGLVIPNSITTIYLYTFFGCSGLTSSLIISQSVTSIEDYAFSGCSGLTEIVMLGITPPSLWNGAIDNTNTCPVFVPYESLNDYKTATNWSNYEDRIFPIAYKTISGYGESEGNWRFIASPLAEKTAPTEIDDMLPTTGTYDLYRFDQTENAEWRNYKANNFNLVNGQGYLYANAEDVNLIFKGTFNEDETKNVELVYDANASFAGWNLVGNPFPVSAYANKSYYTMNEEGTAIEPVAVSMETAIPACTGVMVKAENTGESVTFSKTAPETTVNQGVLQIVLSQLDPEPVEGSKGGVSTSSTTALDKAIVSFNEGDELGKFVFNKDNAKLYIPQGNEEYAIACAEKLGEMPLNFEASETGEYTICIKAENVEFDYLHLIDNLTGTDIDLLPLGKGGKEDFQPATYTFTAKTTDYASRFRLLFSVSGDADGDNDTPFAFISNGSIIVSDANADATLQIVDMAGHIIVSADVARNISTNGMAQGVYVLRLIKGDEVKTQRIVVE